MHGTIWRLWKINGRRGVIDKDQNLKYYWTNVEISFFFFSSIPWTGLKASWNSTTGIKPRTERAQEKLLFKGETGWRERTPEVQRDTQWKKSPLPLLFFSLFAHTSAPGISDSSDSGDSGDRQWRQWGGRHLKLREVTSLLVWRSCGPKRLRQKPIAFLFVCFSPMPVLLLLGPGQRHSQRQCETEWGK